MVSWSWTANVPTRPPTGKGIISDPLLSKAGKWLVVFNADSAMRILCSLSQDHCFVYVSSYLLFEANLAFPEIFRIPPKILPQWKFTAPAFSTRGHMGTEKVKQKMFLRKKMLFRLIDMNYSKTRCTAFLRAGWQSSTSSEKRTFCGLVKWTASFWCSMVIFSYVGDLACPCSKIGLSCNGVLAEVCPFRQCCLTYIFSMWIVFRCFSSTDSATSPYTQL